MAGVLGSAMDIVIQLSSNLIDRAVRSRFESIGQSCFEATIDQIPLRKLTPTIDQVRLTEQRNVNGMNIVSVAVDVRVLYGEANVLGNWVSLESLQDMLGYDPRRKTVTAVISAEVSGAADVLLTVTPTSSLEGLPEELREAMDIWIRLPVGVLDQRLGDPDDEDAPYLLQLSVEPPVQLKLMPDGALAIGMDVTLRQDTLPGDDDEDSEARGGTPGHCGLPDQPEIWDAEFAIFQDEFTETFIGDADWGIALDKHIVDAMLRGLPSAGLNRDKDDPDAECAHEGSIRFACLQLDELRDEEMGVSGRVQVYVCPSDPAPDGWWVVCFSADATLRFEPGRGIVGAYTMHRDVEVCGSDSGWTFWIDVISFLDPFGDIDLWDYVPEEVRQGTFTPPIPNVIGSRDDTTGRLRINGVRVRTDGLIVTGTADVQLPEPRGLRMPERVLFGDACGELANSRRVVLTGAGRRVRVCPLAIHDLPEDDAEYVQHADRRFSIVEPPALMEGGDGVTLDPGESVEVRVLLDGEPDQRYAAKIDVPNNSAETIVRLVADLRGTRVSGDIPREILLRRTQYVRPCNQGYPRAVPIRETFAITHDGPGFLHICDVVFSDFEEGIRELGDDGELAVDAAGEPLYHWNALGAAPEREDGTPVFQASYPVVSEPGTHTFTVVFAPDEAHAGRRYRAQMRIITNAGDDDSFVIAVTGHLDRAGEFFDELGGGFDEEVFCGDADWDRVQDGGGRLLDAAAFQELFELLGGVDCCPPPKGPACLCIDLFEFSFAGLPAGLDLVLLGDGGPAVAHDRSGAGRRTFVVPVARDGRYALRVEGDAMTAAGMSSSVRARRWILQQDGFYRSDTPLHDLALLGDQAVVVSASTIDVVDLSDRSRPQCAAQVPHPDGRVRALRSLKQRLLMGGDTLGVYSFDGGQLHRVAAVRLPAPLEFFLADYRLGATSPRVWAWSDALVGVSVASSRIEVVARAKTRVHASAGFVLGSRAFVFGDEGMEAFDLSPAARPASIGFLHTKRPVRNAVPVGGSALLLFDDRTLARVPLADPTALRTVGEWQIEESLCPFVPLRGPLVPHGSGFVALAPTGLGIRVMHLRRNRVHAEKLQERRTRRRARPAS